MTSDENRAPRPNTDFLSAVAWLFAAMIAAFAAINTLPMSYSVGGYVPAGNDSFYHARRILDTVEDPAKFYEFDTKIQAPEGGWVTWPWAYDYSMAMIARGAMVVSDISDPMTVLAYVPVIWTFINTGLIVLISAALGLGVLLRLLAGLAFALSMINQVLHGVGMLDHHYIELTFILLAIWSMMQWARHPSNYGYAALAGGSLGIAPAFHVALFILQLPALLGLFRLWIAHNVPAASSVITFSACLISGTLLMLLGSEPFWLGFWNYYLFSWFHLYIASLTALAALCMARWPFSVRTLSLLACVGILAAAPLVGHIAQVSGFFGKSIPGLSRIVEVQPITWFLEKKFEYWMGTYFTYLLVFTPLTLVACAWVFLRKTEGHLVAFASYGMLCLLLLFAQFRFQYFGLAFLILGPLWAISVLSDWKPRWRKPILAFACLLYAGIYAPSFAGRMDRTYHLGSDYQYRWSLPLMPELSQACQTDPGIVLASSTEGNYVRYHTDCSIITNNFLLTEKHARKYAELAEILTWPPQKLREDRPGIKYVLATFQRFGQPHSEGSVKLARTDMLRVANAHTPLMLDLLLSDPDRFAHFELLDEVQVNFGSGEKVAYSRLYRIRHQ